MYKSPDTDEDLKNMFGDNELLLDKYKDRPSPYAIALVNQLLDEEDWNLSAISES